MTAEKVAWQVHTQNLAVVLQGTDGRIPHVGMNDVQDYLLTALECQFFVGSTSLEKMRLCVRMVLYGWTHLRNGRRSTLFICITVNNEEDEWWVV